MQDPHPHLLDELAANAWPAEVVQNVDGWRLRFNGGVTQRANSVWPTECQGEFALEERIAMVEDFYTRRGMRARYQISPASLPGELDALLEQRGYAHVSDTRVQTASILPVQVPRPYRFNVTVGTLIDAWMDTYAQAANMGAHERAMRRGIVSRIGPRSGFALARLGNLDGQPVAVGLGVAERGWTGIFCMDTLPSFRRQGAATAILQALSEWGASCGAARMYLQVMADNAPAVALYARAGFTTLYSYHYREAQS